MLDIRIFDVDHGFSAIIDRHNHHTILIDVGFNAKSGFGAWQYLVDRRCRELDCLIIPVYVEEHLEGVPELLDHLSELGISVKQLIANPTLNLAEFPQLQEVYTWARNPLLVNAVHHPEAHRTHQLMTIDDVDFSFFWNEQGNVSDLRNLSLVTFLSYGDITMIFPSDLKVEGWRQLLQKEEFRAELRRTNVFVAANHGQEDGYCPEVFAYCHPDLIIISNDKHQPLSLQMKERYEEHAKGSPEGVCDRKLLTTYDQGTITVSKYLDRLRQVTTAPQGERVWMA